MRSKEIAQAADDAVIASSVRFVVNWFVGRTPETYHGKPIRHEDLWSREEFGTLRAARARVRQVGKDEHGRSGVIYAVSPDNMISVFVDDNYEERAALCQSR